MQRVSTLKRFQTILCKIVAAIGVFFKIKITPNKYQNCFIRQKIPPLMRRPDFPIALGAFRLKFSKRIRTLIF